MRATGRTTAERTGTATPPTAGTAERGPDAATRRTRIDVGGLLVYLLVGVYFGFVLTKSEAISWFRIQEMFRFQGFHMYGIFASAVGVAALSVALIRRFDVRTLRGETIALAPKEFRGRNYRYWIGGSIFGVGWALLGACPGPVYALIGNGYLVFVVALVAALAGTWTYGRLQPRLPHH